ncbi:protein MANNAN SYNTHESIS-RELATED 1-like [Andrographis paniculata]|uniref:protein MANNAN SYNTHESIS-RELATED 1-like n=1 Tax=Andrographis paniculata TaxID=175694 RepID=UPI0021E9838E|nr:protein MANNAN SYNTHESIS-RELATED 1-like [Andrographis paniculata]
MGGIVDLRHMMSAVLTFSMFIMLGHMIKRDHIDPALGPLKRSPIVVQYSVLKVSKTGMLKLSETNSGPWNWNWNWNSKNQHHHNPSSTTHPCWNIPSILTKQQETRGYIFFTLTPNPEFHASQVANAVAVARHLRATLALPDIRGSDSAQKRNFSEIYDVDKFVTSLDGVVAVNKNPPAELSNEKLTVVRIPDKVTNNYIDSIIRPIFKTKGNLKIITLFSSKEKEKQQPNPYQCLAITKALKLQPELQNLAADSSR